MPLDFPPTLPLDWWLWNFGSNLEVFPLNLKRHVGIYLPKILLSRGMQNLKRRPCSVKVFFYPPLMREKVEQLFCRLWRTLTSYFWPQIDQFNTKIAKTGVFGVELSSSWIDNSAILLYKPITRKTRWVLILLFALVDLEMELVPKGYYIDANVSTGRRLLRVVFTLKSMLKIDCFKWISFKIHTISWYSPLKMALSYL